jgi:uncharacterized protein
MRIEYLDGVRLRRALIAACDYVQRQRAELNRINVFPVPDGDTGTNLTLTAAAIADRLRTYESRDVGQVAQAASDAAILGARGNCGMILSHFLQGFAVAVAGRARVTAVEFAGAMQGGVEHVYHALERPVEGTIITVMRDVGSAARDTPTRDFVDLLEALLVEARAALERTPELLPALRMAGVVDAGAKGFVHLMEGVVAFIHGDPILALSHVPDFSAAPAAAGQVEYPTASERYRFCTEALVRGDAIPEADAVRAVLREQGDSLIVIRGSDVLKVHIHTDAPEAIFQYLRTLGTLATHKAEDMQVQHAAVVHAAASHVQLARRPVSVVTDSSCDLPDEIIRAHGIQVVPLTLIFESGALRDRVDINADQFVDRLRAGERPTTSQPPPAAFLEGFRRAGEDGETIVAVLLSKALSGTYGSAEAAARMVPELKVEVVDSAAASLTLGMLVLKAAELGELGWAAPRIAAELKRIRQRSGLLFTVDVFDNLLASGRVGRGQVMIAGLLDVKPILGLAPEGTIVPFAKVRGAHRVLPRMLALMEERVPRTAQRLRLGIIHVGYPEIVAEVQAALVERYGPRETITGPASAVLATHLGPKAWGLAWQWED